MADITVELVSVERMLWSGQASIVTAQTIEGEIGVLPGHEPMLGQLVDNGVVTIRPVNGDKLVAAVQGGFLSISKEKVTILAEYAVWADEVNVSESESHLQDDDAIGKARAQAELKALRRKEQS
ncbi:F0F1 ATP synthase subunit epsilon [Corynebacterium ulcerans]|uniref:ATP synthase epsilon chain n=2 Tax=Corynebacterium ulcerans TaxID=65058 RepID=A0ABD0BLP5_CORUL|nr:F0F1 ATP synthase subunit epsilon [Corynebacterium ulcerans]AEG83624.1 ATP synthase epsilon chain [Corynebacterium ulcerans BR-AD22]AIT88895.1 ATP synthase epsilon chain [Corynebacterium ulcerans]AKN76835.1 ATP synthase epsilon chain [Corynebacterium ulcerans FRC58]ALD94674.1 ATP synthase epsilon chain [Corynebacterium ulcerans]KPH76917.1 ATP synthase F0F1 subunit epsilon [Corynebacterium ulcerans]